MKYFDLQIILGIRYLRPSFKVVKVLSVLLCLLHITYSSVKQRVFPSLSIDLLLLVFEKSLSGVIFHKKKET